MRPLDRLPLFARAGSAVPLATLRRRRNNRRLDRHPPRVPRHRAGSIYDDDGESFSFRSGEYAVRSYDVRAAPEGAVVTLSPTVGTYRPSGRRLRVALNGGEATDIPNDWENAMVITVSAGP